MRQAGILAAAGLYAIEHHRPALDRASDIVEDLQEDGVLLTPFGPSTIRATTHRDVSMDETEEALSIIQAYYSVNRHSTG